MTRATWDNTGERLYETGVDRAMLYLQDGGGNYTLGSAWNGMETLTESPSGAEATATYADNIKYLNLISIEQFGGTINDVDGTDHGYKLHLVWGALAQPSEKAYGTINDSPEAISFSWAFTTTPVNVDGYKPTAYMSIDSTKVNAGALADLEDFLYGTVGTDPSLPSPTDVIALFTGTVTSVFPTAPTYNNSTHTITIPSTTGVIYSIGGVDQAAGPVVITHDTIVDMRPATGYIFTQPSDDSFFADYS
jgi:hypothetical protein